MNPATIFLVVGMLYLAIIAYGVVRSRKKGLPKQLRITTAAIQVILPPAVLFGLLVANGDAGQTGGWGIMLAMLLVAGALLALCTDIVARRVL